MGSKKHKKESKKKKHRSRSRSPLEGSEERERKKHRKHKDRKKDRSPDVEEVPVDSHLAVSPPAAAPDPPAPPAPGSRSASRERDRRVRGEHRAHSDKHKHHHHREKSSDVPRGVPAPLPQAEAVSEVGGGGGQESLSVDETNRLRAKLGLKPLELHEKPAEDGKIKDDLGEFYHKPAANLSEQKKTDKIRQKLEERKEKRKIEQKLKTSLLADDSDGDDAAAWVTRSREIDKQKQDAAKRAALLDEMDNVFGVGALVEEEQQQHRAEAYSHRNLRGLRVAHDLTHFEEERDTILTLADKEVLADDAEDVLVNVNIVDDQKYKKNISEAKKARAGYQAYDEEMELELASGGDRSVLHKYDDVIAQQGTSGGPEQGGGFLIGDEDGIEAKRFKEMMRRERVLLSGGKRLESLQLPALQLASDYMNEHEVNAKFKKTKRKGKIRKKAKHEPIDVEDYDAGNAPLETDDTEVVQDSKEGSGSGEEAETELDAELHAALARARRLALSSSSSSRAPRHVEDLLHRIKEEEPCKQEGEGEGGMVVDSTAEFCRTLGDIPTYGLAGNRDNNADIMEVEVEEPAAESSDSAGTWARVDLHADQPPDLAAECGPALVSEPVLGGGLGGALQVARSKGYLQRLEPSLPPASRPAARLLHAKHYSIEDKTTGEDDKYRGRGGGGGGGGGPVQEFREKSHFKPTIKLEYVDDDGHPLCPKEAFRYLSHKFHGKGPGKNKQEKRIKKQVQEGLMKKMSSTDTPLNTLQMLQDKQRETHSPYVVLSGARQSQNN